MSTQRFQEEMWRNFNQPKPRKKKKVTNKMTERIRQLAEQAGYKDLPTVRLAFQGFDKEKFAQLIVEECAQRAEAYTYMSANFSALAEELRGMHE